MALTNKFGIVSDCFPDKCGKPDFERFESDNRKLFDMILKSNMFSVNGVIRLLDVGSGNSGSDFVNRFSIEFPNTEVVYLDKDDFLLKGLDKPNKVCADATQMPFPDGIFDIAYAGGIISSGILGDHLFYKDQSYKIAQESYRVLKTTGVFLFTYYHGDDIQTSRNLKEIGFKNVEHLLRIKWYGGIPNDTYLVRK